MERPRLLAVPALFLALCAGASQGCATSPDAGAVLRDEPRRRPPAATSIEVTTPPPAREPDRQPPFSEADGYGARTLTVIEVKVKESAGIEAPDLPAAPIDGP